MRPIWKGHIAFGLVNVPVTLYPAEQRADLNLHLIDSRDNARVRYERVNTETGEEVPWNQVVRGYEYSDGNYVILGKEELQAAAPKASQTIEIDSFVNLAEIDHMYFDKPYYLEPGKGGDKGYALLRDALHETGMVGVARVVIRTRQYMAAMIPVRDGLVLMLLRYAQEIRPLDDLRLPGPAEKVGVTKREQKMARDLVASLAAEWRPDEYHDEYREQLMQWINERVKAGRVEQIEEPEEDAPPPPISIMEALQKSLAEQDRTEKRPAPGRRKRG